MRQIETPRLNKTESKVPPEDNHHKEQNILIKIRSSYVRIIKLFIYILLTVTLKMNFKIGNSPDNFYQGNPNMKISFKGIKKQKHKTRME